MNRKLIKFTKCVLDIMFYGGIFVLITLPFSIKYIGNHYYEDVKEHFLITFLIFGIAGIFGVMIISQLRQMMKSVLAQSCFIYENVKSLRIMAGLSIGICGLFILKMFLLPTFATAVIILVFFIAALFSEVLSYVFEQAVKYKEENDFTI